jgi:hypothetical protein
MHTSIVWCYCCCNHKWQTLYIFVCILGGNLLYGTEAYMQARQERIWEEGTKSMSEVPEHRSEVTRLLLQISAEYEAAQRGLSGLAYGTSQHEFITARMEIMGRIHTQLQVLVGDNAIAMIAEQLSRSH